MSLDMVQLALMNRAKDLFEYVLLKHKERDLPFNLNYENL
jgi:hypothetical protein